VLIAIVVGTIWWLPMLATVVMAAIVAAIAAAELVGFAPVAPFDGRLIAALSAAVVCLTFADGAHDIFFWTLASVVVTSGLVAIIPSMLSRAPLGPAVLTRAALQFMAPFYVGVPLGAIASVQFTDGPAAVTFLLVVIAVSDSAQYYAGRAFGRRKLAAAISPAKTVEGAIGGLVAAVAAGACLAPFWLAHGTPLIGAVVASVLALLGMLGDLFESLLKRSAGVKDSSSIIPGHGGLLDRLDSWLFAAPVYYVFLRFLA